AVVRGVPGHRRLLRSPAGRRTRAGTGARAVPGDAAAAGVGRGILTRSRSRSRSRLLPRGEKTGTGTGTGRGTGNKAIRRSERRGGMKGQAFLKHAAVYGAANLLLQAAGFVLLPLYTRCLGPRDFGVLEVLGRLGETVSACLLIGG